MKPIGHIITTGIISILVAFIFNSFRQGLVCMAAGIFIDLDHIFDYAMNHGFTLSPVKVYKALSETWLKKIYLFLHSYELIFALLVYIILTHKTNTLWMGAFIGLMQHLLLDQFYNSTHPLAYFLTFRIIRGFKKEHIVR